MFQNTKLKTRLLVSFLLVTVTSIFLASYLSYTVARSSLEDQVLKDIFFAAEAKEGHLYEFLWNTKGRVIDFSSDGFIRDSTKKIITGAGEDVVSELNEHLLKNKMSLDETIYGINIIDFDGYIIASTQDGELGRYEEKEDYFHGPQTVGTRGVFLSDIAPSHHFGANRVNFVASALLTDRITGEPLGVIVNYLDVNNLNDLMSGARQVALGAISSPYKEKETLEAYLVNHEGFMVTQLKSLENSILQQRVFTEPIEKCATNEEMMGVYENYRGVSVVGASMCINNGWTLLVEIEKEEALAGAEEIKRNIVFLALVLLVAVAIFAYFLIRDILNALGMLSKVIQQFGGGDFSQRAKIQSKDEIGILAATFNRMAEKLEVLDRTKSEFVSLAAHQLRSPLVGMGWSLEVLLRETTGKITKKQKDYLDIVYNMNKRMIDLVSAFLNVTRVELGTFTIEPKPTKLKELTESIFSELSDQIKSKKLAIHKYYDKDLPAINVDPILIRIIFQNLFSNAVKYTPDKGTIELRIEKQQSDVLLKISDTGYGIPKDQQSKIFTRLFRASNITEQEMQGTGLGLYLVKSIIDQSGGKIWFESKENHGTTFYVTIPLSGMKKRTGKGGLEVKRLN